MNLNKKNTAHSIKMTAFVPLTEPDKLGLLLQCRMKMDKLNDNQLNNFAHSCIHLLSNDHLKQVLFVGLNSIKNEVSYNQIFDMRSKLDQIITQTEELKTLSIIYNRSQKRSSSTSKLVK